MIVTTRLLPARRRTLRVVLVGALLGGLTGCGLLDEHQQSKIPHLGVVDPHQPRELQKVSMPPYVVEPPDDLEISVRPAVLELPLTTVPVQPDGVVDLGYYGDVYVAGLTLDQVELKIAQHLATFAARRGLEEPVEVSVRILNSSQSKVYYVIGTVSQQGRFPLTGNETVLDAILLSGLRANSLPEKAYLARPQPVGAGFLLLRIDWERIKMGDTLTNYQLFPGDRVIVPGTRAPGLFGTLFGGF